MKMLMTLPSWVLLVAVLMTTSRVSLSNAAVPAVCGVPAIEPIPPAERIIGGIEAKPNSWPWMCWIEMKREYTWGPYCVCTALNNVTVLTGAQCVLGSGEAPLRVVCGNHYLLNGSNPHEQIVSVSSRTSHELFSWKTYDYDVGILKLSMPLTFNDFVSPVCLPQKDVGEGTVAVATGWGVTHPVMEEPSNVLRQVMLPVFCPIQCGKNYAQVNFTVTDRMMCAGYQEGGKGLCMYDAGDPLVTKRDGVWEVQGLGSYGQGCAQKGFPTVFTRVLKLVDWIKQRM